jgi:predicted metal-binding membrane protein
MMSTALERALRHDRLVVLAAIAAVTALAWIYTTWLAAGMDMPVGMATTMAPAILPWSTHDFLVMWVMWVVMMVGMMLPSVTPMVLIYARVARHALGQGKPFASTGWFAGGYLLAWAIFAIAATVAQWALEQAALLSPMAMRVTEAFGGGILVIAGLFQFTPWKDACLSQCQAPLVFLQRHGGFRREPGGAILLGVRHGHYCIGCCWALMCLLFVAGVMNLVWIAIIMVFVLLEKVLPAELHISRIAGVALLAAGAWALS